MTQEKPSYRTVVGFKTHEICGVREIIENALEDIACAMLNPAVEYAYVEIISYTRIKEYVRGKSNS